VQLEINPFASKIICGDCNKVVARKGWRSATGVECKAWQCSEQYKVKEVMGCANRHVEGETLVKAYLTAWNVQVENMENTDGAELLTEMDMGFMQKTLGSCNS
jgi:hypothetical protein